MHPKLRSDLRQIVNRPVLTTDERVLEEKDLGNGSVWRLAWLEEVLVFTADAFVAFTTGLPANARVVTASMNLDTVGAYSAESGVDAVKLGLGTEADPDAFALSGTAVTKNDKTNKQPVEATALVTAAVTPRVTAAATNGAAASVGTYTGSVRARLLYEYITSVGSAA